MIESLFLYSIKSAFVLVLLYVPYMLMLRKESFFRLNRAVLLFIIMLSVVLPLLDIPALSLDNRPVVQAARQQMAQAGFPLSGIAVLPEADVTAQRPVSWFSLLSCVYLMGVAVLCVWNTLQLFRIRQVITKGSLWHQAENGVHVYCHADDVAPFSWMNNIVISQKDYSESGREIILHETGHVRACHSCDVLLLALVCMLQWWNPLVYILGISLRDVHEYDADDHVLRHGVPAHAYQLLLIKKVVGSGSYTFANNFDHSLIIKRITMMQKKQSSVWMRSKVLYIVPMAALALSAFASGESVTPSGTSLAAIGDKGSEKTLSVQAADVKTPSGLSRKTPPVVLSGVEDDKAAKPAHFPVFDGGEKALFAWLERNVHYPEVAQAWGVVGKVLVRFVVAKDGTIRDVSAIGLDGYRLKDDVSLCENVVAGHEKKQMAAGRKMTAEERSAYASGVQAIIDEAMRVVKAMPQWTPAYEDAAKTRPCDCNFTLPICFVLK